MEKSDRIYVAGHEGLVGSALVRLLRAQGYSNLILKTRSELDLLDQHAVRGFFEQEKPQVVFFCAGRTGGVYANDTYRADFIYQNLTIETNVIHQAFLSEVRKLMFFGCSSMYPKLVSQPMKEDALLTGALEPTSEPFAIAKLAGTKLCESYFRQYGCDFITVIPTNLYGLEQDYTPLNCQIVAALVSRFHEAKIDGRDTVEVWGSGRASRDFLFADDLADAALFLMQNYSSPQPINIGTGSDITVREVAGIVAKIVGYGGSVSFDQLMPEGVLMKLQDVSRIKAMGWQPKIGLEEGLRRTYQYYVESLAGR